MWLYLIDLLIQMPLSPSQLSTDVSRGRRWSFEPHATSCYKTVSPPGTEPWLKRQKPDTLPLDHIANVILDQGQYWKYRWTVKFATDTVAESQRGVKVSTSSKVVAHVYRVRG